MASRVRYKNDPMHGEVSTSNATGAEYGSGDEIIIYPSGYFGSYAIDTTYEFLVITDVVLSAGMAGLVTLFCDTDSTPWNVGSGETITQVTFPTGGGSINVRFNMPFVGKKGCNLYVLAANSGQVSCQVQGYIRANPTSATYANYAPDGTGRTAASV